MTALESPAVAVLVLLLLAGLYLLRRCAVIRSAAKQIDATYKRMMRQPLWTPIESSAGIPAGIAKALDAWEEACRTALSMRPLARFKEHYADGEALGVRSVTVSDDGAIVGTLATSLTDPRVAFRSFGSLVGNTILVTTDSRAPFERPAHIVFAGVAKNAPAGQMYAEHAARVRAEAGTARKISGPRDYTDMQTRIWSDTNALRSRHGYAIDLGSLRQLAKRNISERTLRAIHAEIVRLNAPRADSRVARR